MPERATFGFTESSEDVGAPRERPLVNIDALTTLHVDRLAEHITARSEEERRGSARISEAAVQNLITRSRYHGTISDPQKFRLALIEAVQRRSGRQMTREIDRILAGVDGVLNTIRTQQEEYARARVERPTLHQFIGLNDALDARHAIDLVDIWFEPGPPLRVTDVAFIQAKAGAITTEERSEIHATHHAYYTEHLATLPRVEQRAFVTYAVAEVAREVERNAVMANAIALEVLTARDTSAETLHAIAAHVGRSALWLTCFLRGPAADRRFCEAADTLATDVEERMVFRAMTARLVATAHARDLPLAALRALFPTWTLNPRFIAASSFASAIDAGSVRTTRRLNQPGDAPRTLTVHAT